MAWPTALALSRAFPGAARLYAGGGERLRWLAPLGFEGCPPGLRRSLDGLYGAREMPEDLADCLLVWPYVERRPDLPRDARLWALPAVEAGGSAQAQNANAEDANAGAAQVQTALARDAYPGATHAGPTNAEAAHARDAHAGDANAGAAHAPDAHARDVLARSLSAHGVNIPEDWLQTFRMLFASERRPGRDVLLFPGAGHPLKQWPLVQFFQLADMLAENGWNPRFVLGPAELERGMDLGGRACAPEGAVETLEGLERLLLNAAGVVGADTGPMHLAGMLGVPGVALFGPTRAAQWGPVGLAALEASLECAPCTRTCADLDCPEARCMAGLDAERVWRALEGELTKGNRLSSPGILESRSR